MDVRWTSVPNGQSSFEGERYDFNMPFGIINKKSFDNEVTATTNAFDHNYDVAMNPTEVGKKTVPWNFGHKKYGHTQQMVEHHQ